MTNKTKTIGLITEAQGKKMVMSRAFVTARFTSDKIGETLSLECLGQQITVPFEAVMSLVDMTRERAGVK